MPPDPLVPFVGRDRIVSDAVDRAVAGHGTLLVAPGGGGRSRALAATADALERAGLRVARLTATTAIASAPFGLFLGVLDPRTTRRIALADPLGRAVLVRVAVQELGLDAVVVDEISLVDPASAAFLLELARDGAVVVAGLTAGRQVRDAVHELAAGDRVETVRLPPLTRADVAEVTAAVLRGPVDGAAAAALWAASEGNPGSLRELIRESVSTGTLVRVRDLWRLEGQPPSPRTLRRRVAERLELLPGAVRDWVTVVAVADQLADDLGERLADDRTADAAEREGWTEHDPVRGTTRIRQRAHRAAIVDSLGSRARRSAVRRLADATAALERPLVDAERIAFGSWRLELGSAIPVEESLALSTMTALSAPDLSERLLRDAVAAGGGPVAEVALADLYKGQGRLDALGDLLGAARAQPHDELTAAELVRVQAISIGFTARQPQRALAVLDEHVAALGDRADLQAVRCGLLLGERRLPESIELGRRVTAGSAGFPAAFAGMFLTMALLDVGDLDGALEAVERVRAESDRGETRLPDGDVIADWLTGYSPFFTALDVAPAVAVAVRGYDLSLSAGLDRVRSRYAHLLGMCRILQADPVGAVQLLREAEAGSGPWHDAWLPRVLASLAEALALSGDLDGADRALDRLSLLETPAASLGAVDLAIAQVAALRDRRGEAARLARDAADRAVAQGAVVEAFDARYAAMRHGDPGAARLLAAADTPPGAGRDAQRAHARAVLAEDAAALAEAASRLWGLGLRLHAVEAAQSCVTLRVAQGLDAGVAAERLAMWLLHVPGLRTPAGRDRDSSGLTSREREVVRLAAQGLSDRAIAARLGISVRTAQTHIGRAFGKLGVHRRSELRPMLEHLE